MSYIMLALGWVLNFFYILVGNYGVAILLFTLFIKLVLMPLTVKQQRSMLKTAKIQPLLMEVQQKYGNDKEKLNQETMKIYQKYQINPVSGCLPLLIQLPILMALYWVVRKPIIYTMGFGGDEVWRIVSAIEEWGFSNPDALKNFLGQLHLEQITALGDNNYKNFGMYEIQVAKLLHQYPEIMQNHWITEMGKNIKAVDFNFLGLDLSATPNLGALLQLCIGKIDGLTPGIIALWSIPVLSGLTSFISVKYSQTQQPPQPVQKDKDGNEKTNPMKTMTMIMPFFSAWITFTLPAAVGLYWIASNLFQMLQQWLLTKMIKVEITDEQIEGEIINAKKNRKKRKK